MYWRPLFPFQKEVIDRMIEMGSFINGDDTGLGKTDTSIYVSEYWGKRKKGKTIIICRSETVKQWVRRIKITTYKKNKIFLSEYGNKSSEKSRAYRLSLYNKVNKYQYIVLSYNQIVNDYMVLFNCLKDINVIIFDECRKIKNRQSKIHKYLVSLLNKWRHENKELKVYGLDATLLPNKAVEELFWIMEIINPSIFGSGKYDWYKYCKNYLNFNFYGGVHSVKNLGMLYNKFKYYFLKRSHTHKDVKDYIPITTIKYYECNLGSNNIYKFVGKSLLKDLDIMAELVDRQYNNPPKDPKQYKSLLINIKKINGSIRKKYQSLKQISIHTGLLLASETNFNKFIVDKFKIVENIKEKGKIFFICEKIKDLILENKENRILVMCYFLEGLNYYSKYLSNLKIKSIIYKGGSNKWEVLNKFKSDTSYKVLLLQSTVGGCGLDIPEANHIFRDILETPADMIQQNRTARLGSNFKYNVLHDIVCKNTIEQKLYQDNKIKESISNLITEGKSIDKELINSDGSIKTKIKNLRNFLKEVL